MYTIVVEMKDEARLGKLKRSSLEGSVGFCLTSRHIGYTFETCFSKIDNFRKKHEVQIVKVSSREVPAADVYLVICVPGD